MRHYYLLFVVKYTEFAYNQKLKKIILHNNYIWVCMVVHSLVSLMLLLFQLDKEATSLLDVTHV